MLYPSACTDSVPKVSDTIDISFIKHQTASPWQRGQCLSVPSISTSLIYWLQMTPFHVWPSSLLRSFWGWFSPFLSLPHILTLLLTQWACLALRSQASLSRVLWASSTADKKKWIVHHWIGLSYKGVNKKKKTASLFYVSWESQCCSLNPNPCVDSKARKEENVCK